MPVQKFRSPDEARRLPVSTAGSEENVRRLRSVLDFWSRPRPKIVPRGVFKYRPIEDAQRDNRWL